MKDDIVDVDHALQILEGDTPLVEEPRASRFVVEEGTGVGVPRKRYWRAWHATRRIQARVHRELRALVPVTCRICGQSFKRNAINQRRCTACVKSGKRRA